MNEQNAVKFNSLPPQQQYATAVAATQELPFAESVGAANTAVTLDGQPVYQAPTAPQQPSTGMFRFPPTPRPRGRWDNITYSQEKAQPVQDGALFHGQLLEKELRYSSNDSPYIYCKAEISNGWSMCHTRFLPKKCKGDSAAIAEATLAYLTKFGYNASTKSFAEMPILCEIGSWTDAEGKKHYNVQRIFLNEQDREGYYASVARKQQQRAQQQTDGNRAELPDV